RPGRQSSRPGATGAPFSPARKVSSPSSGTKADRSIAMTNPAGPAPAAGPLQALPPRQFVVPWIAVAALAVVAWAATIVLARDMGNGPGTMGLALLPFLGLWGGMMAAMMLPSGAPVRVLWSPLIACA